METMTTATRGVVRHETDQLVRQLVRQLLSECRSTQTEYTLEHLLAALVPALVDVAKAWSQRGAKTHIQPVNLLARHLYRNNPTHARGEESKVAREQRLVREMIVEERKALRQQRFDARFRGAVEQELLKMEIWPLDAGSASPKRAVHLHSREVKALLREVEAQTGRPGFCAQLEVILEVLDARGERKVEWADLVDATESLVTADRPGSVSKWLFRELRAKVDQALEEYYGCADASELVGRASRAGDLTGASLAGFLHEVRDVVLAWDPAFEPEEVLDARETKCSDMVHVAEEDFANILQVFLDRLTRSRMDAYGIFTL